MLDLPTLGLLAGYNRWADEKLYRAVAELPERECCRPLPTLFGSMLGTLNHNYQVDLIWKAHLTGEQHGYTSRRDILHPTLARLAIAQRDVDDWFLAWAARQSRKSLQRMQSFDFVSGRSAQMRVGGIFLHVINHKTYHRGWVSEMFFTAGAKPPEIDLCIYLTKCCPAVIE